MSNKSSRSSSQSSSASDTEIDTSTQPEFIYGGPFIKQNTDATFFLDGITPINSPLQGTFKQSFAHRSLKDRMPIILTKVIDQLSKRSDAKEAVNEIAKMKNELVTNKMYTPLKGDTEDAQKWNGWIEATPHKKYFNNSFLFTECYIYRRLRDIFETTKGLQDVDPFQAQKEASFNDLIEASCVAADELERMVHSKDSNKQMFSLLLKMSLWSNKCDLMLTVGSSIKIGEKSESGEKYLMDPVKWVEQFKPNVLIDDSMKVPLEYKVKKKIDRNDPKLACNCAVLAKNKRMPVYPKPPPEPKVPPAEGAPPEKPPERVPCPSRVAAAQTFFFDIICDNVGFELVMDLIVGDFLIQKKIAHKVRFHVKLIPWFISDVTTKDFRKVIQMCAEANYSRNAPVEPPKPDAKKKKEPEEPPPPPPPRLVTSDNLRAAGQRWLQYLEDGTFLLMTDAFWTSPHPFKEMKKYAFPLYRKLQYSQVILFKGDLNYRKLLGDIRVNPNMSFLNALQGFFPAPIVAVRTVKCDIICAAPKPKGKGKKRVDKFGDLNTNTPDWMETGNIGVIQYCKKKEPLKASDMPCPDYGETCLGVTCPVHTDLF